MLYIIICQDLHRLFEMEMTRKFTPQFVETAWSVSVTALNTIVVYQQLLGASSDFWNGDDRKATRQFVEGAWSVSVTALFTVVVQHKLSGPSSTIWNTDDGESDTSVCRKGVKWFSNSFKYDCCISSFVRTFIDYLKWRGQENWHLKLSKGLEVFQ